jgi:hypothetical protein
MKYDIFVSYRRADRELVASIVRRLEARGVGVWYDAEIDGGADWRETIVEALTNSDMLAIFFSEDCNNSRQLKKELAVADSLGKAVVPILIENTQPRGAYLYELADRNWIQMWPEPMDRMDELVEHLATLAGKSDGGLEGAGRSQTAPPPAANDEPAAAPAGVGAAANDDAAPGPQPEAEQQLVEAVEEFISSADGADRPAPKIATAYVGHVGADGRPIRKLNDILPFRWIDLLFLVPLLAAGAGYINMAEAQWPPDAADIAATGLLAIAAIAAYGALVFPVRYYLRRRPPVNALGSYILSSGLLYLAFSGSYLALRYGTDMFGQEDPGEVTLVFAAVWGVFTIIAFVIYGALAGQRAIRSFRLNIRKI